MHHCSTCKLLVLIYISTVLLLLEYNIKSFKSMTEMRATIMMIMHRLNYLDSRDFHSYILKIDDYFLHCDEITKIKSKFFYRKRYLTMNDVKQ